MTLLGELSFVYTEGMYIFMIYVLHFAYYGVWVA